MVEWVDVIPGWKKKKKRMRRCLCSLVGGVLVQSIDSGLLLLCGTNMIVLHDRLSWTDEYQRVTNSRRFLLPYIPNLIFYWPNIPVCHPLLFAKAP